MFNELKQRVLADNYTQEDISEIVQLVDRGQLRVAEFQDGQWIVNSWVKKAILKYFISCSVRDMSIGEFKFRDKIPLKQEFENVRIVPGGNSIRYGSYLADNVIMMPPSYVNIGAYIDEGSMIDSNVLVGSCAQVGKHVHLSAGVQIGGVLEPASAQPVIVEDHVFLGAGVIVVEGFLVRTGAVIAPGVVLSASTRIIETDEEGRITGEFLGEVPENAIVVPGARQRGEVMLQTPVLIGYKNKSTSAKIQLTDFLRQF